MVSAPDPKQIVREGYDLLGDAYRIERFGNDDRVYRRWLAKLDQHLAPNSRVLDLGCGYGVPASRWLARKHRVVGVDGSSVQLGRAKFLVPGVPFVQADMTDVEFRGGGFDAVVSMYAIIHVPLADQPALFHRIAEWLTPSGWFMGTLGWREWTGIERDWLGVEGATMYWSHAAADRYRAWLEGAGLAVVEEAVEPEGEGGFSAFLAQRRSPGVGA